MPTFIGGTAFCLLWIDSSGTLQLQDQYTKFTAPWQVDLVDTSAGSVSSKQYLPTLKDATADYEGFTTGKAGTLGTAALERMKPGSPGTLVWAPLGTATGNPKGGGFGYVKQLDQDFPFANAVTTKLTFQYSGDLAFDPYAATF